MDASGPILLRGPAGARRFRAERPTELESTVHMDRIPVGILGATGAVGQRFVQLLADHPWFEVTDVAASDRSAGRPYREACTWRLAGAPAPAIGELVVSSIDGPFRAKLLFSGLD